MGRLEGKIALITGSARGIGQAIAQRFVQEGAYLIATDIQDNLGQQMIHPFGRQAEYQHLDVSQEDQWQQITPSILAQHGRLDILVNNAGITGFLETPGPHDPENLDMQSWHHVQATNLDGVALGCKYGIKMMKGTQAGSLINISSRSGLVGIPAAAAYAASKAAVRNHSKSVALYCAEQRYPIRCNSIHPGAILTPMWDAMLGQGEPRQRAIEALAKDIPLGVMGEADDVAYAALYLASDESKYVTGIELNIDGGILAGSHARPTTDHSST
ncbi:SDR family oxidoreductase [Magnetococcus sp. PR-3]|uniref:SDR family oxidoreductase n=1 Tax=Magnetococcus sp. PR-3 TaxID=3120355 RepID=UPI002FCDF07E